MLSDYSIKQWVNFPRCRCARDGLKSQVLWMGLWLIFGFWVTTSVFADRNPYEIAVLAGDYEEVKRLVSQGVPFESADYMPTSWFAFQKDVEIEMSLLLMKSGLNPFMAGSMDFTDVFELTSTLKQAILVLSYGGGISESRLRAGAYDDKLLHKTCDRLFPKHLKSAKPQTIEEFNELFESLPFLKMKAYLYILKERLNYDRLPRFMADMLDEDSMTAEERNAIETARKKHEAKTDDDPVLSSGFDDTSYKDDFLPGTTCNPS